MNEQQHINECERLGIQSSHFEARAREGQMHVSNLLGQVKNPDNALVKNAAKWLSRPINVGDFGSAINQWANMYSEMQKRYTAEAARVQELERENRELLKKLGDS